MKNSIHFFGDSFTEGHALHRTKYVWPVLVCEALETYECKNHGEGSASPLTILKNIINQLVNIKPGDIVIVLETIPDRIEIFSAHTKKIISLTNAELVQAVENKEHKSFDNFNDISSAFNFIYDHRYKRLKEFANYYSDIYRSIGKYLHSIDVKFILLPFQLSFGNIKDGDKFETVTKRTKGKHKDDHFSTKGHWQFANFVLENNFKTYKKIKEPEEKLLI